MSYILNTDETPLIRTDFSDEVAWAVLIEAAGTPSPDGFLANLHAIDDPKFEGLGPEQLRGLASDTNHTILFVADRTTLTHPDLPVLCVDVFEPQRTFRVIPSELWSVENNLSLANMDFEEFDNAVDVDGIFRGFQ